MKIENITRNEKKIANQFIISNDNVFYFQSYESMIAKINFNKKIVEIGKNYNYSKTTTKYRNIFFKIYNLPLQTSKELEICLKNEKFIDSLGIEWKIVYNSSL